jgi:ankyrin repeat protein
MTATQEQRNYFESIASNAHYQIEAWLADKDNIAARCGVSLGGLACLMMIRGHIELAEAMVAQGVAPTRLNNQESILGGFYGSVPEDDAHGIGMALAMIFSHEGRNKPPPVGHIKPLTQVWEHILSKQDVWPVDINESWAGRPIIALVSNGYDLATMAKRTEILDVLVRNGVDINQSSDTTNAAENAIYSTVKKASASSTKWIDQGREEAEGCAPVIDHLLGLGFDPTRNPHIAFSCAIGKDAQYALPNEGFGIRTRMLLDRGFPLHSPIGCPRKVNPFFVAIENGQTQVVKDLLAAGCDPLWIDPETQDTLMAATGNAKKSTVEAFLALPDEVLVKLISHRNKKGDTPLHQAVALLSLPIAKKLVELGADINATNKKGKLPLQTVTRSNPKAKKQLQEIVALFESMPQRKTTATQMTGLLHQACKSLADDLVSTLLEQGADPNERDRSGRTPLIVVASSGKFNFYDGKQKQEAKRAYEALVDLLVDSGADINAQDKHGNTALHEATSKFSDVAVMVLLNSGARTDILNKKQLSAAHLWEEGIPWNAEERADAIVQLFVAQNFNINLLGPKGELPFAPRRDTDLFASLKEQWELRENTTQPSSPKMGRRL